MLLGGLLYVMQKQFKIEQLGQGSTGGEAIIKSHVECGKLNIWTFLII